jgi:hypothetical protein
VHPCQSDGSDDDVDKLAAGEHQVHQAGI